MNTLDDIACQTGQFEQTAVAHHASSASTQLSTGLGDLAQRYDAFLVDQWGVLHDGHKPYPGVLECLERLARAGKPVIIISNSGKRAACNEDRLDKLGLPRSSYAHLVTSGEIAWQMLADGSGVFRELMATPCLMLTSDRPEEFAKGLSVTFVDRVEEAGFILLAGIDDGRPPAFYEAMVEAGVARRLPLICVNPDHTRITSNGLQPGTGAIAQTYEAKGGEVHFIGKPYPGIYRHCLTLVPDVPVARVLAVGDSMHHDVVGGVQAGLDTLLTMGGVHTEHFIDTQDPASVNQSIRRIAGPFGPIPNFAAPAFRW